MISLPPGTYDIEGRPVGEAKVFSQRKEGIVIEAGSITKDTLDYTMGSISILCIQNGQPVDVGVKVYRAGTNEFITSQRSYRGPRTNPAVINLPPGQYDIIGSVIAKGGVNDLRIENMNVMSNQSSVDTLDFSTGSISVKTTENGALTDCTVSVVSQVTKKSVSGGRTYTSENHNPFVKDLSPGRYDVTVKSVKIKGLAIEHSFKDVVIQPGQMTSLSHDFKSGVLKVKTTYNGALCDAGVNITSGEPKKSVGGSRTYANPKSNPKSYLLNPGTYEITVRPVRVPGASRKSVKVELKAGEELEIEVAL